LIEKGSPTFVGTLLITPQSTQADWLSSDFINAPNAYSILTCEFQCYESE